MIINIYNHLSQEEQEFYNPYGKELYIYSPSELIHSIEIKDIAIIEAVPFYSWADIVRISYMVIPEFQHKNIATYLMCHMLDALVRLNYHKFRCEVNKNNVASLALLDKFGFFVTNTITNRFYLDKEIS